MARLTQAQVEDWIAKNGGSGAVQYGVEQKQIKNNDMTSPDAYTTIEVEVWRNGKTGAELTVRRGDDGDFEQIENKSADPSKPASTASDMDWHPEGTPDGQGGYDNSRPIMVRTVSGRRQERQPTGAELKDWNEAQQRSRNPGGKTDAEVAAAAGQTGESRVPVPERPGWTKITRKKVQGNETTEAVTFIGPDGKEVPTLPEKPAESKTTLSTINGQPGYRTVVTPQGAGKPDKVEHFAPDGKPIAQLPAESGTKREPVTNKPGIVKVTKGEGNNTETYYEDDKGNRVPTPTEGIGNLKDLPSYQPDLTKPGAGLNEYAKQLDEYMASHPEFTWEKRQQVLASAQAQAKQVTDEWNIGARALETEYQGNINQRTSDMTQANSRATLANSHYQNAVGMIEKFAPYLGVTPGDAGKMFMGMMASQLATATMYGGMQNQPRVEMDPRLTAFADRMPGGPGSAATPPATPGTPPTAGAAAGAPAQPNALGLGQLPPVPPQAQADAELAAAVKARQAASGQPLPAPILGPTPGTPAPYTPPPLDNVPVPPPANAMPQLGQGQDLSTPPVAPISVQPVPQAGAVPSRAGVNNGGKPGAQPFTLDPNEGTPGGAVLPQTPVGIPSGGNVMMSPGVQDLSLKAFGPPDQSMRETAQQRASFLGEMPSPQAVALGGTVFGGSGMANPYAGFSLGGPVGPAPMALQSRIPGLTPDVDAEARRQLALEMGAA